MLLTSTQTPDALAILRQRPLPVAAAVAVKVAVVLTTWSTRRRTRAALAQLEPWQLADVGLTSGQADAEASRMFWQG